MREHTFNFKGRSGAYRIVRLIGRGRTAEVHEAVREGAGPDEAVALRCLRRDRAEDPALVQRMLQEADILAEIHSPSVTALLDRGSQDGAPFLVLELVQGKTLRERLVELGGSATVAVSLCFARQIADAAGALHAAGAIHGDLRPETIRLTTIDEVKLCDLGSGAPLRSPERGGAQTDVRALGVMLAEMMAGRTVRASSLQADLSRVPPYVCSLIERVLLADPKSGGVASMTAFAEAIEEAWSRLLQDSRAGAELRRALDVLAGVLQTMGKPPGAGDQRPLLSKGPLGGGVNGRSGGGGDEGAWSNPPNFEVLLQGVIDATKDLNVEGGDEGGAAGSGAAVSEVEEEPVRDTDPDPKNPAGDETPR